MSRSAQWLLAVAVICLTAAVALTYGSVPSGAKAPDTTVLWLIGILALAASVLIDNRRTRNLMNRVPMLRSAAYDLSRVLRRFDQLREELDRTLPGTSAGQIAEFHHRAQVISEDARKTVARHTDREHWFTRGIPPVGSLVMTADWFMTLRGSIDPQIGRLEELVKEQR